MCLAVWCPTLHAAPCPGRRKSLLPGPAGRPESSPGGGGHVARRVCVVPKFLADRGAWAPGHRQFHPSASARRCVIPPWSCPALPCTMRHHSLCRPDSAKLPSSKQCLSPRPPSMPSLALAPRGSVPSRLVLVISSRPPVSSRPSCTPLRYRPRRSYSYIQRRALGCSLCSQTDYHDITKEPETDSNRPLDPRARAPDHRAKQVISESHTATTNRSSAVSTEGRCSHAPPAIPAGSGHDRTAQAATLWRLVPDLLTGKRLSSSRR